MKEWFKKMFCRHEWEVSEVLNSGAVVCYCKKCGKKMVGRMNCRKTGF